MWSKQITVIHKPGFVCKSLILNAKFTPKEKDTATPTNNGTTFANFFEDPLNMDYHELNGRKNEIPKTITML